MSTMSYDSFQKRFFNNCNKLDEETEEKDEATKQKHSKNTKMKGTATTKTASNNDRPISLECLGVVQHWDEALRAKYYAGEMCDKDEKKKQNKVGRTKSKPHKTKGKPYLTDSEEEPAVNKHLAKFVHFEPFHAKVTKKVEPQWVTFSGQEFIQKSNGRLQRVMADDVLKPNGLVGLYFAAHWSAPCRAFTRTLLEFHRALRSLFEVIFLTNDLSQADMEDHMLKAHGDWLGFPHDNKLAKRLHIYFDVKTIPTLIIVDRYLTIVTNEGVDEVIQDGLHAYYKWMSYLHPSIFAPTEESLDTLLFEYKPTSNDKSKSKRRNARRKHVKTQ